MILVLSCLNTDSNVWRGKKERFVQIIIFTYDHDFRSQSSKFRDIFKDRETEKKCLM